MAESLYDMIDRIQQQQREDYVTIMNALTVLRDAITTTRDHADQNFETLKRGLHSFELRLTAVEKAVFGEGGK